MATFSEKVLKARQGMRWLPTVLTAAILLIGGAVAPCATITVDTLSDASVLGQCSLRDAIDAANSDTAVHGCAAGHGSDTIVFAKRLTGTITLAAPLPDIQSNLAINGPSGGGITISGNSLVGIMTIAANVEPTGITVELNNLTFIQAKSVALGAVLNFGALTVTDSTFMDNEASNGGAIVSLGTLTVMKSTFVGNKSLNGGAIAVRRRTRFEPASTIINSTFVGNDASQGGAISNLGATLALINNTFSLNTAVQGGVLFNISMGIVISKGSIFAGSTADDGNCFGEITDAGYNISDDATCLFSNTGSHNNTDPLLDPNGLARNGGPTETIALQSASPALDAIPVADCTDLASPSNAITTDQRGALRPDPGEASCDIGAYEFQPFAGKANCHGKSVAALVQQYGNLKSAASAYGFPSVKELQAAIETSCGG